MPKHKVGDHVLVKLSGGRIVATIKAIVDTTDGGVRLQVSFGDETAFIYLWQVVEEGRWRSPTPLSLSVSLRAERSYDFYRRPEWRQAMQLTATVKSGGSASPQITNPDGSQSPFVIPNGNVLVVTDISIQRESVVGAVGLFNVSLEQNIGTASELRWAFVGSSAQNIERSFTTGIAFSTPFVVQNGVQLGDAVVVRLWGFLQG